MPSLQPIQLTQTSQTYNPPHQLPFSTVSKHPYYLALQKQQHITNPALPPPGASASGSPRPLAKVRTSFVAIADKDGRLGLRQPSDESTSSGRKLSGETDAEVSSSSSLLLDNNSQPHNVFSTSPDAIRTGRDRGPSGPVTGSLSGATLQDAGPGSAPEQHKPAEPAKPSGLAASSGSVSGSAGTNAKPETAAPARSGENPPSSSGPISGSTSGPTQSGPFAAPRSGSLAPSNSTAGTKGQKGLAASPQIREASGSEGAANRGAGGRTGLTSGPSEREAQVVEESKAQRARDQGQAPNEGSESARHGSGDKERPSAAKGSAGSGAGGVAPALNGADKAKTTKPAPASSTHQKTAGKTPDAKGVTTPAPEKKSTEKKAAPPHVSPPFVKPRPKSPTQPVKLPERLTTHTAASATRTKNGAPPPAHANRPASRTSMGSSGKGLGRSSSVTGRQHASFGPPPKQSADHTVKESKPVDESFLARMMRPTQAYANKVADKVQLPPKTPPHATTTRRPASSAKTGAVRKVSRSTAPSTAVSPETNKSEPTPAAKHTAKKVEKPIAEEALPVVKKVEKSVPADKTAPVEKKQEETVKEPVKVAEKKSEPSTTEIKQEAPKPVERETVPKAVETNKEFSKPVEKETAFKPTEIKQETPKPTEKKEDQINGSEKVEAPKMTGQKVETSKPFEKKDTLDTAEKTDALFNLSQKVSNFSKNEVEKENIPKSSENSWDFSKSSSLDRKDDNLPDKTFGSISGQSAADEKRDTLSRPAGDSWGFSNPADKQDSGNKFPQKSADDKLAAFMKGGSEKADASQSNGNKTIGSGFSADSKPQHDEEEW